LLLNSVLHFVLKPNDTVSLVSFNLDAKVLTPSVACSASNLKKFRSLVDKLVADGGTDLAKGLQSGFDVLRRAKCAGAAGEFRMKRVFFLTDMESSQSDEAAVLALAKLQAAQDFVPAPAAADVVEERPPPSSPSPSSMHVPVGNKRPSSSDSTSSSKKKQKPNNKAAANQYAYNGPGKFTLLVCLFFRLLFSAMSLTCLSLLSDSLSLTLSV
jgi:hypothetical protein